MLKKVNFVYSDTKHNPVQALDSLGVIVNKLFSENPDQCLVVSEARVISHGDSVENRFTAYCTVIAPDVKVQPLFKNPFD